MKKHLKKIIMVSTLLALALLSSLLLLACDFDSGGGSGDVPNGGEKQTIALQTPVIYFYEHIPWVVLWNFIENSKGFDIYINDEFYTHVEHNAFGIDCPEIGGPFNRIPRFEVGKHTIRVRAIGEESEWFVFESSELSQPLLFEVVSEITNVIDVDITIANSQFTTSGLNSALDFINAGTIMEVVHTFENCTDVIRGRAAAPGGAEATYFAHAKRQNTRLGQNRIHFEVIIERPDRVINGVQTFAKNARITYKTLPVYFYGVQVEQPRYLFMGQSVHWAEVENAGGFDFVLEFEGNRYQLLFWGLSNSIDARTRIRTIGQSGTYVFEVTTRASWDIKKTNNKHTVFLDATPKRLYQSVEFRQIPKFTNVRFDGEYFLYDSTFSLPIVDGNTQQSLLFRATIGEEYHEWLGNPSFNRIPEHFARVLAGARDNWGRHLNWSGEFLIEFGWRVNNIQWGEANNLAVFWETNLTTAFSGVLHRDSLNVYIDGDYLRWADAFWANVYFVYQGLGIGTTTDNYVRMIPQFFRAFVAGLGWQWIDGRWHFFYSPFDEYIYLTGGTYE